MHTLASILLSSQQLGLQDAELANNSSSTVFKLQALPYELQEAVLSFVQCPHELSACASTCQGLRQASLRQWQGLFERDFGQVAGLLLTRPPKWWGKDERPAGRWRHRYKALVNGGQPFQAQVLSRELENPAGVLRLSRWPMGSHSLVVMVAACGCELGLGGLQSSQGGDELVGCTAWMCCGHGSMTNTCLGSPP